MVNDAFFENQKIYHELKDSVIKSDSGLKKLYADLDEHRQELEELATSEGEFMKMLEDDMEKHSQEQKLRPSIDEHIGIDLPDSKKTTRDKSFGYSYSKMTDSELGYKDKQDDKNQELMDWYLEGIYLEEEHPINQPSFLHRLLHRLFGRSKGQSIGTQTGNRIVSKSQLPNAPIIPEPRRMKY